MSFLRALFCCGVVLASALATAGEPYLIGRGKTDITGPAVGVKLLGYVRPDQIGEGIHLRQYARTFIVAEPDGGRRLVLVNTDLQSITHSLVLSVLDKLKAELGPIYNLGNVVIAATHTHAVPGGYWHYGADTALGSPFHPEHFQALVDGIAASILAAHRDLAPGRIKIAVGPVEEAGAQRSRTAYLQNPEAERNRYATDTDVDMILLRFERGGQPIGIMNWHAVHPTSMSYHNKLLSSDNKGYAEYAFERARRASDPGFVAAFCQSNGGDVTPNLTLNQRGPGQDEFASTRIIGERMCKAAERLFTEASEELSGPVDSRQAYVNLANLTVDDAFTHAGEQSTFPAAYGYSFGAGSTEDGGGQPMFREGMLKTDALIEAIAKSVLPLPQPSEAMRAGHMPKPILLAAGAAEPAALPQVLPVSVARIGQLGIAVGPCEYTTMSGRRFRDAVKNHLPGTKYVAVAGYANDYSGYVATREEYEVQHYEGASTLFGPWTQAAYEQEFARLAADLAAGRKSASHEPPLDVRGTVRPTPLGSKFDPLPPGKQAGDVIEQPKERAAKGEIVQAAFVSGNPQNGYRPDRQFAAIERKTDQGWTPIAVDGDWDVKIRWKREKATPGSGSPWTMVIEWTVPPEAAAGAYRIAHHGVFKPEASEIQEFSAASRDFQVE